MNANTTNIPNYPINSSTTVYPSYTTGTYGNLLSIGSGGIISQNNSWSAIGSTPVYDEKTYYNILKFELDLWRDDLIDGFKLTNDLAVEIYAKAENDDKFKDLLKEKSALILLNNKDGKAKIFIK